MADDFSEYQGSELELFAGARNWKAYWAGMVKPFVSGRVLDVGAGIGSNIAPLIGERVSAWTALEPDDRLAEDIRRKRHSGEIPPTCEIVNGTLEDIDPTNRFDTIVYIDVLEHIPSDGAEMRLAAERLAPGGHLVVLSPAHQYLFSPFDAAIGHVRRYDKASLSAVAPPGCDTVWVRMLDSCGFFLSLANRLIMRSAMPTVGQIATWDKLFVPVSRVTDPLLGYAFGKTILAVWRKRAAG